MSIVYLETKKNSLILARLNNNFLLLVLSTIYTTGNFDISCLLLLL